MGENVADPVSFSVICQKTVDQELINNPVLGHGVREVQGNIGEKAHGMVGCKDHLPKPFSTRQFPAAFICDFLANGNPAGIEFQPFGVVHCVEVEVSDREVGGFSAIGYVIHNRGASFKYRRAVSR
jgi:hypothetical protein